MVETEKAKKPKLVLGGGHVIVGTVVATGRIRAKGNRLLPSIAFLMTTLKKHS